MATKHENIKKKQRIFSIDPKLVELKLASMDNLKNQLVPFSVFKKLF